MLKTRLFSAKFKLAVAALAAASAFALLVGTGSALAATAASSPAHSPGTLYLRQVKVKLSPPEKAQLAASGVADTSTGSEIVNAVTSGGGAPYCLDAEAAGPLAGDSGDPVQIWHCNGTKNQLWYAGTSNNYGDQTLVNAEWPSKCLNINDNFDEQPGSLAQLWSCSVDTPNEFWDVGQWETNVDDGSSDAWLILDAPNLIVLDASNSYSGEVRDGDLVQVWSDNGNSDEEWGF
jgi:hypothetical protein